jgi:hypothetical protein
MDGELSQSGLDSRTVAAELDAAHDRARAAYARRDVDAYMAMFHPALAYTQPDGRTIGHEQLARDVRAQLARVDTATSEFRREALEVRDAGTATETLEQRATFAVRAFGFLRREWTVSRRGRYEWVRTAATWQIRRVEVLWEEVVGRFSVGVG